MNAISISLHVVAAVVWIGGMFFAYVVLRPAGSDLDPPLRLTLWAGVFKRFFPWVWMSIILLMVTGYWLIFNWFEGLTDLPTYVHIMHVTGWVMALLFFCLYYLPYRSFKAAVADKKWPDAGVAMNRIRLIVLVNLILGLLVIVMVTGLQRFGL